MEDNHKFLIEVNLFPAVYDFKVIRLSVLVDRCFCLNCLLPVYAVISAVEIPYDIYEIVPVGVEEPDDVKNNV